MRSLAVISALAVVLALPLEAQVFPTLGRDTPRIQSVVWKPGQRVILTALPETALTVMLERSETVSRATLEGSRAWEITVSAEANSFQVTPQQGAAPAILRVETGARSYEFALETNVGLQAAYIVRLIYSQSPAVEAASTAQTIDNLDWGYRVRGDRSVRPVSIRDNGAKTVIEYRPDQALPAVFAIGPSGDEEVVDAYMRGGLFIIDRVHEELVFRIDKEKARAKRNKRRDGEG
ncbi:MAG: TrbG/VirB9 family P-type conjugative transfer protein [Erythrobacter sp.]